MKVYNNGIQVLVFLFMSQYIPTIEKCKQELNRIIKFYNTERPHMSIGMQTPTVVHLQTGKQK